LTDSEEDDEKSSTKTTIKHLSRTVNDSEIKDKSNDSNKSNTNGQSCTSALYSEWNLNSSDFEQMHQEILKQSQDCKGIGSLKFDIDYIRMGGFTSCSDSDIQFDQHGLKINTTRNKKLFKCFSF